MKVFISWSGELSRELAKTLKKYLHQINHSVDPYFSPDTAKGTRWASEITRELKETKIGLICLTKDNLESPWLNFEAGAIS